MSNKDRLMSREEQEIVNLTRHEIVVSNGFKTEVYKPSGVVCRVTSEQKVIGTINGIPVVERCQGQIENLPEPRPNTIYLASSLISSRCPERDDIVSPDISTAIRKDGRIVAVTRFTK